MVAVTKTNDAFGMELMAFYDGEGGDLILERGDNYIEAARSASQIYFNDYKKWSKSEKEGISFVRGKTLDLGCGAGRIGLYLQKKKIDSLSIDNSPLSIKVCKLRGVKRALLLDIEKLSKLKEKNFKAITMFGNNFGLLGTPARGKRILKRLHYLTTDDAIIVAQSVDITLTKNPFHLAYQRKLKKIGKLPGELKLRCRYKNIIGPWFDYLMVTPKQMSNVLLNTGWEVSRIIKEKNSPIYFAIIKKRIDE